MIQVLFVTASILYALVLKFCPLAEQVNLKVDFPERIIAGKDALARITIDKGTVNEFGILELKLHPDLNIKTLSDDNAEFSNTDGNACWRWKALPDKKQIVLEFYVTSKNNMSAPAAAARFLFVDDNSKKVIENAAYKVFQASNEYSNAGILQQQNQTVKCFRTVTGDETGLKVVVRIKKGNTSGFARYSDALPEGSRVGSVETDGSSFSVADGKLRFVWVNVPEKEELKIAYTLVSNDYINTTLAGEYSYLEDNKTQKVTLAPTTIVGNESGTTISTNGETEEPVAEKEKDQEATPVQEEKPEPSVAASAPEQGDLAYRVQIGAFKSRKVTSATLKKRFKVLTPIVSEFHEGFSKFMTGNHAQYVEGRDNRNIIIDKNGIKSAFVVAYNHGKRITVQEALMISKQKWYK